MTDQPNRVRLATQAMATRFELLIDHPDGAAARAAGEEALAEIRAIERRLSFYDPTSLLSAINRDAAEGPVRVFAPVFDLLVQSAALSRETNGAFDPTIGPMMQRVTLQTPGAGGRADIAPASAARVVQPSGPPPLIAPASTDPIPPASAPEAAQAAPSRPTINQILLDPTHRTVSFTHPDLMLDLGGIGKGFALDEAMEILLEAGIENALIHGGTSTARAIGVDGNHPFRVAISHPHPERAGEVIAATELRDQSLSVSGIYGRGRLEDGTWLGHVIDPRTGASVRATELAAVVTDTATRADALSTALLVLGNPAAAENAFRDTATLTLSETGAMVSSGVWERTAQDLHR